MRSAECGGGGKRSAAGPILRVARTMQDDFTIIGARLERDGPFSAAQAGAVVAAVEDGLALCAADVAETAQEGLDALRSAVETLAERHAARAAALPDELDDRAREQRRRHRARTIGALRAFRPPAGSFAAELQAALRAFVFETLEDVAAREARAAAPPPPRAPEGGEVGDGAGAREGGDDDADPGPPAKRRRIAPDALPDPYIDLTRDTDSTPPPPPPL